MIPATASALRSAATVLATFGIGVPAIWGGCALWYRIPGNRPARTLSVLAWTGFGAAVMTLLWQGRAAFAVAAFAVAFAVLLAWWTRLRPGKDHDWADDVSRMTTGEVLGSRLTLHNVRNFDWRTTTDFTQRWETRSYDLDALRSVDMIMSHWRGPAIAHMLISFGFEDGAHVAFSVEIRRRKSQAFSEIGGFFKEFELSIIAADERDVIRVRTNVRGEDDYLYRLQIPIAAARRLLLGYVGEANSLVDAPRFYNTISVNCTTLVYQMMKRIVGHLPLDYRLLFSGYLPEYVYRIGGLDHRYSLQELRAKGHINRRARDAGRAASFSADIRREIPGMQ